MIKIKIRTGAAGTVYIGIVSLISEYNEPYSVQSEGDEHWTNQVRSHLGGQFRRFQEEGWE